MMTHVTVFALKKTKTFTMKIPNNQPVTILVLGSRKHLVKPI